jgi:hypothetical protein
MFFVPNRLRDVTATALVIRCDLQHHATTDAAVSAHGVHGILVWCHGLPGHAYIPPSIAIGLALHRVSSLCGSHISAFMSEISAALRLPLNGEDAAVKLPANPAAAGRVIAGHR